jgi:hypothetical protein
MTKESKMVTSSADHHAVQTMLKKAAHSTSVFTYDHGTWLEGLWGYYTQ